MKNKILLFNRFIYSFLFLSITIIAQTNSTRLNLVNHIPANKGELFKEVSNLIVDLMNVNDIPGLSIGVVNKDSVLWVNAFGIKQKNTNDTIDTKTVFSLQSISKTITATGVMLAVQEGLVSLDTPIVSYIKEFTVNSKFEKNPEKKITLRHLLSHRAGFTHEAPAGNNFQTKFDSFEQHISSISNTWLKFPVGDLYSYSNLGIDLAGYIIQVRSGMTFEEYIKKHLFIPLEMYNSSFDWEQIRNEKNRAIGHSKKFNSTPLEFAMIPAGACYTNVIDMSKFLQFHLNRGKHNGKNILESKYFDEMYEIPFTDSEIGYALCVEVADHNGEYVYSHGGGGFGFQTHIRWIPSSDLGIVVLTNSTDHNNIHKLIADSVVNKLLSIEKIIMTEQAYRKSHNKMPISFGESEYSKYSGSYIMADGGQEFQLLLKDSVFGAQSNEVFIPFNFLNKNGELFVEGFGPEIDGEYRLVIDEITQKPLYLINKIDRVILYFNENQVKIDSGNISNWKKYIGSYSFKVYESFTSKHNIQIKNGCLYFDLFCLEEYIPNLFYASNGEVLDFRGEIPTYRNILLCKDK